MSDYFDRLLTRHVPAAGSARAAAEGRPGTSARVRPRLPGPYERAGAPREGPLRREEPGPFPPPAPRPAADRGEDRWETRRGREIRTEHRTVVRTGPAPRDGEPRPPATARTARPLPRPAGRTAPAPRPATEPGARRDGRTAPARTAPDALPTTAAPAPAPRGTDAVLPPAGPPPLLPGPAGASAARDAARAAGGRRRSRPAERTVHVQIGRLEVRAAPPPGADRTDTGRPRRPGRPAPALSLADYLADSERRG